MKYIFAGLLVFILFFSGTIGVLYLTDPNLYLPYVQQAKTKFIITDAEIYSLYDRIWAQTGQTQKVLPLVISNEDIMNAFDDGKSIVLYRGLIDFVQNEDELALVIGHEISHFTLGHLGALAAHTSAQQSVLEANADKMGALYMMKAGFDICKGRMLYKRWMAMFGNSLGLDHPDFSYRYDELNVHCDH